MKWWEVLRKYVAAPALTAMTVDSWYRSRLADIKKNHEGTEPKNTETFAEISDNILMSDQNNKLISKCTGYNESWTQLLRDKNRLSNTENKIKSGNFGTGDNIEMLKTSKDYQKEAVDISQDAFNAKGKALIDYFLEVTKKSGFDWIWDLIDQYRLFVDSLGLDQKVALINLIGYITIFNTGVSIAIILGGNHLIQSFKLEEKYPWLSKVLRVRAKLNSVYLRLYITLVFIIVVVWIILNLYILFFNIIHK